MASVSDIETVRLNTNESTTETYSDDAIGALVDASGVAGATASIWEQKAARFSELVNVSEAGASHAFSDLHKNAVTMAAYWGKKNDVEDGTGTAGRPRIRKIERE